MIFVRAIIIIIVSPPFTIIIIIITITGASFRRAGSKWASINQATVQVGRRQGKQAGSQATSQSSKLESKQAIIMISIRIRMIINTVICINITIIISNHKPALSLSNTQKAKAQGKIMGIRISITTVSITITILIINIIATKQASNKQAIAQVGRRQGKQGNQPIKQAGKQAINNVKLSIRIRMITTHNQMHSHNYHHTRS
mgnify:CR=1 FL=1